MQKNVICSNSCKLFKLLIGIIFLVSISETVVSQINIEGIEGLSFTLSETDYEIQITDSFSLHGMNIQPENLMLNWNSGLDEFSFSGDAELTFDETKIKVGFGTPGLPGLIIRNDSIINVDLKVSAEFSLKGLSINPKDLTFIYDKNESDYNISGEIELIIEGDTIIAVLGDSSQPGIEIKNDSIKHIDIDVSTEFSIKSLKIKPTDLTFIYDKNENDYNISGEIELIIEGDTIAAVLGDTLQPGIEIKNGSIEHIDIDVTTEFSIKSLTIHPTDLTFVYDKIESDYNISGDIELIIEGDTIAAVLGDSSQPGFEIKNGSIEHIDIDVTTEFSIKSLTIHPTDLTFVYDKKESDYNISGDIELIIEEDNIDAILGDTLQPGFEIKEGKIDHIDFGVSTDFKLKTLEIAPDNLIFEYDRNDDDYNISGSIKIAIEGDSLNAILGNATSPGIEIKSGKVDKIDIGITSDFKLKGLEIKTDSLGFAWQKDSNTFNMFGEISLTIENDIVGFSFGDEQSPGLIFDNGKIISFKIGTTDTLHFGGLEVTTENFTIEHHQDEFHISGQLSITELWKAVIDLGNGHDSGVTLNTENGKNTFEIDQAKFELGNIDLGPITIKDLTLIMKDNKMVDDSLGIEFPPGWEVDADLRFTDGKLDGIDISWETDKFEEAIEIPGTGTDIIKIEGGVFNFHDPHNFYFKGDIGLAFGGPFNIPEVGDVSLLYLHAGTTISRSEFMLEADALMGAYKNDTGWVSFLGDGHLKFDFKWGDYYSFNGNLNVPSNPWTILKADIEAKLSASGTLNAHIGVHLQAPPEIPIIGGHEFAEAEGIIYYDKIDPASYAAGWAKLDLGFYTLNGGVKYSFKTHHYETLGSKDIKNIQASPTPTNPKPPYLDYLQINVENENPHFIQVKIYLKEKIDLVTFGVLNPLSVGQISCAPIYFGSGLETYTTSGINISTLPTYKAYTVFFTDSILFYIMAPGYQNNSKALLPTGQYTVEIINTSYSGLIKNYQVHKIFSAPYSNWTYLYWNFEPEKESGSGFFNVAKLNYHIGSEVYNNDSTTVRLFYTKHVKENGELVKTVKYKDYYANYPPDGEYLKIEGIDFPVNYTNGDSLFLYLTIDDGINATYKSPVMYDHFRPPFQATVQIDALSDSLTSGIEAKLYLLNPADNQWYESDTLKHFTNKSGVVSFPCCLNVSTKVKFVFDIPFGYEVDPDSPYKNEDILTVPDVNADCGKYVTLNLRKINNQKTQ